MLFVYGTLKSGFRHIAASRGLARMARLQGQASIRGTMHSLGRYPAVKLHNRGRRINGELFALKNPVGAFRFLDRYEEAYAYGHDYTREVVWANTSDGAKRLCQTYVFKPSCYERPVVPSGRFMKKSGRK